jgi:hypothetical protein
MILVGAYFVCAINLLLFSVSSSSSSRRNLDSIYQQDGHFTGNTGDEEEDIDLNRGGEDAGSDDEKISDSENSTADLSDEDDADDVDEEDDVVEFVSEDTLIKERANAVLDAAKLKKKAKPRETTGSFVDSYRPAIVSSTKKSSKQK